MSIFQPIKESKSGTPTWALEKIKEAKKKKSKTLALSPPYDNDHVKLTEFPDELSKLSKLTSLSFRGNQLTTLPKSISQLQNLKTLNFSWNEFSTLPELISDLQNL